MTRKEQAVALIALEQKEFETKTYEQVCALVNSEAFNIVLNEPVGSDEEGWTISLKPTSIRGDEIILNRLGELLQVKRNNVFPTLGELFECINQPVMYSKLHDVRVNVELYIDNRDRHTRAREKGLTEDVSLETTPFGPRLTAYVKLRKSGPVGRKVLEERLLNNEFIKVTLEEYNLLCVHKRLLDNIHRNADYIAFLPELRALIEKLTTIRTDRGVKFLCLPNSLELKKYTSMKDL